jgi:hypothetical protein
LNASSLPLGVTASIQGQGNSQQIAFKATPEAATGFAPVTVTGTSGDISENFTFGLAVSAAKGGKGSGKQVNLSSAFNVYGIYKDGTTYSTGGLDGSGNSYSEKFLNKLRILDLVKFTFGPTNEPDAVACNGQLIALPSGSFSNVTLLATGVQGSQSAQTLTVNYTDGTSAQFVQNFSDWSAPQNFPGEGEAVAMSYRDTATGTKDEGEFNLYAYQFALDSTKVVQSITLPNDPEVVVLAATLVQ